MFAYNSYINCYTGLALSPNVEGCELPCAMHHVHMALRATADIAPDGELLLDYGPSYFLYSERPNLQIIEDKHIMIRWDTVLNQGTNAIVYEGYFNGNDVALKVFPPFESEDDEHVYHEECKDWAQCRHPNIVQCYGRTRVIASSSVSSRLLSQGTKSSTETRAAIVFELALMNFDQFITRHDHLPHLFTKKYLKYFHTIMINIAAGKNALDSDPSCALEYRVYVGI
jgi:hypothetical protein